MIVMMGLIGWKVWGVAGAAASALAIFGPACAIYFVAFRLWDRFRESRWQAALRRGLIPVTVGLVVAGGCAVARSADTSWPAVAMTVAAATAMLTTRINPLWPIGLAAALGGLGLL
jgi:chromate transporter